jgi:hypothetical protein
VPSPLNPYHRGQWHSRVITSVACLLKYVLSSREFRNILAINPTSNIAASFYSITLNFQILVPRLAVLPRYISSLVATGVSSFSNDLELPGD